MKKFFLGIKAIIVDSGKVLLLERNFKTPFWEAPGGRIDEGESVEEALIRELKEELPGISDISIKEMLGASKEHIEVEPGVGLIMFFYKVEAKLIAPLKLSDEHKNYIWLGQDDELPEISSKELHRIVLNLRETALV